jgi:hypothetical protein
VDSSFSQLRFLVSSGFLGLTLEEHGDPLLTSRAFLPLYFCFEELSYLRKPSHRAQPAFRSAYALNSRSNYRTKQLFTQTGTRSNLAICARQTNCWESTPWYGVLSGATTGLGYGAEGAGLGQGRVLVAPYLASIRPALFVLCRRDAFSMCAVYVRSCVFSVKHHVGGCFDGVQPQIDHHVRLSARSPISFPLSYYEASKAE